MIRALLLAFVLSWTFSARAQLAIEVGPQNATDNGDGSATLTLNSVSAGASILVLAAWRDTGGGGDADVAAVTITGESNATLLGASAYDPAQNNSRYRWALLSNVTTGGNKTVDVELTVSAGDYSLGIAAFALTGADTSNAFDAFQTATGTGTAPSLNLTTSVSNAAIFVGIGSEGGEPSAGTGYTDFAFHDVWNWTHGEYDLDVGASGSKTVPAINSGGSNWEMIAVAIKPAASGSPPTLSSPTPSGTLGTATTATIGATSDDTTGTFYAVVDTDSLTGITATQVKAAQDAGGGVVVDDCNAAVSTTSPSCGATGLTASTAYNYAAVQNNSNGDSNVVTGTFTTGAPSSGVLLLRRRRD